MDDTWLADVCYADDIILLSFSLNDLVAMLEEALVAFAEVGLEIGLDKTHWTSWPPMPGRHLQVAGVDIVWEPHLTFVGHVVILLAIVAPPSTIAQHRPERHTIAGSLCCCPNGYR